ncbi:MAG: hypothetical protein ACLVL7_11275 [Anaerotruncus massiliensis (ex Togo et al. 2019)]
MHIHASFGRADGSVIGGYLSERASARLPNFPARACRPRRPRLR